MMSLIRLSAILIVFACSAAVITTPSAALASPAALQCERVFYSAGLEKKSQARNVLDHLPAFLSKLTPTYRSSQFDLRVVSESASRNAFSPAALTKRSIGDLKSMYGAFAALGFRANTFMQVLVESHPDAVGSARFSSDGKVNFGSSAGRTPWVHNFSAFIGLPNLFGGKSLFFGKLTSRYSKETPGILFLPAVTETYHTLQNRFMIAHEIAHVMEAPTSHRDLLWREARADFLAYIITGQTSIDFPEGHELEIMQPNGDIEKQTVRMVRSLRTPTIESVSSLIPHLSAYHFNSQLISSALYSISQKLGRERALDLVRWMDTHSGADAVPFLLARDEKSESKENDPNDYVDGENKDAVRAAVRARVNRFAGLFRKWASESNLNADDLFVFETILQNRGI